MQRICLFNSVRFWGGGEKLHLDHALGFKRLGYDVVVACDKDGELWRRATEAGLTCRHVRVRNLSFAYPIAMYKLRQFFVREQIDAVIFTTSQDVKAGALAAKRAGVQRIVYLRGLAVPVKNNFINRTLFTKVLTHIIANSEETKRLMMRHMAHVSDLRPIHVVYHGISLPDTTNTTVLPSVQRNGHGIILGNAGRLTKQKGQHLLIAVAEKLRDRHLDFTLFIAGEGEEREQLEQLIRDKQLGSHVMLLGFIDNMDAFMRSIDIFLLSSMWEGFGFVLVEAMAHNKPIVAFQVSSNPEIVANGETGLLVEAGNVDAFADAVEQLATDTTLRNAMAAAGIGRVRLHFMFEAQLRALSEVIFQ